MTTFYITVSNGLLTAQHKKKMGSAIWEFLWCLDKVTKIDSKGIGWVLGGKAINLKDFKFGHINTVSRNLQKLEKGGYIILYHTPYGISIRVAKAKKRFNKIVEAQELEDHQKLDTPTGNGEAPPKNGDPLTGNGDPNIRQYQYDNTVDISTDTQKNKFASKEAKTHTNGMEPLSELLKRFQK